MLLPASKGKGDFIKATVTFAEYVPESRQLEEGRRPRTVWRRVAHEPRSVEVPLDPKVLDKGIGLPDTPGIRLLGKLEAAEAPGLKPGTRALSLFLLNGRTPSDKSRHDEQYIFQVQLEIEFAPGFEPRPNRRDEGASDWDDQVRDLQFRDRFEWAVGHGVSVAIPDGQGDRVTRIRTTWLPRSEVRRVVTREEPTVVTEMEKLAALKHGAEATAALMPLVDA